MKRSGLPFPLRWNLSLTLSMSRALRRVGSMPLLGAELATDYIANRWYLVNTSLSWACGSAYTMCPSMPVMVSAATKALMMASSVASTVAGHNGRVAHFDARDIGNRVPLSWSTVK